MAANRVGRRMNKSCSNQSPSRASADRDAAQNLQRRHIRVTVKYNRKELQRRMEVEKWIDCELEELYKGREEDMPAEVNIDELLDLRTDEERTERLQDIFHSCNKESKGTLCLMDSGARSVGDSGCTGLCL
ncbi:protein phosphatase 1 regulatory subunit 14A isoform X3 [Gasterosteus aculeatus]